LIHEALRDLEWRPAADESDLALNRHHAHRSIDGAANGSMSDFVHPWF
jgi:hypothetical protein